MVDVEEAIEKLKGKTIEKAEFTHNETIDNRYVLTFTDGSKLRWGYEDNEGNTVLEEKKL